MSERTLFYAMAGEWDKNPMRIITEGKEYTGIRASRYHERGRIHMEQAFEDGTVITVSSPRQQRLLGSVHFERMYNYSDSTGRIFKECDSGERIYSRLKTTLFENPQEAQCNCASQSSKAFMDGNTSWVCEKHGQMVATPDSQ